MTKSMCVVFIATAKRDVFQNKTITFRKEVLSACSRDYIVWYCDAVSRDKWELLKRRNGAFTLRFRFPN